MPWLAEELIPWNTLNYDTLIVPDAGHGGGVYGGRGFSAGTLQGCSLSLSLHQTQNRSQSAVGTIAGASATVKEV